MHTKRIRNPRNYVGQTAMRLTFLKICRYSPFSLSSQSIKLTYWYTSYWGLVLPQSLSTRRQIIAADCLSFDITNLAIETKWHKELYQFLTQFMRKVKEIFGFKYLDRSNKIPPGPQWIGQPESPRWYTMYLTSNPAVNKRHRSQVVLNMRKRINRKWLSMHRMGLFQRGKKSRF